MKKLENLKGAKTLNKNEQQSINGGRSVLLPFNGTCSVGGVCYSSDNCCTSQGLCGARGSDNICYPT